MCESCRRAHSPISGPFYVHVNTLCGLPCRSDTPKVPQRTTYSCRWDLAGLTKRGASDRPGNSMPYGLNQNFSKDLSWQ